MTTTVTNTVTNAQLTAWWSALHGGLAIGSRRPTSYPEWVTLEVAEGGFATGQALAATRYVSGGEQAADPTSAAFMAAGGLDTLTEMLASGRYRIQQPENAALPVVAWLLQQGRADEAKALFAELGPYMDELRFYPYPSEEPAAVSSTTAAVTTVGEMREALQSIRRRTEAFEAANGGATASHRHNQQRRQRAVAEGYAALQGDAIALLVGTAGERREAFLALATAGDAAAEESGADEDARAERGAAMLFADGAPLAAEAVGAIEARAADLAQRFGAVPSHQRAGTTTAMALAALRSAPPVGADRVALAKRLLAVARSRGVVGYAAFEKYLARTAVSAVPAPQTAAKVEAVIARAAALPDEASLGAADRAALLAPLEQTADAGGDARGAALPPTIARAVTRATTGTLDELIASGAIASAEMIATVLPRMLSAAAGACIADPAARLLYARLSAAFAQRRSLLLVNLEKQVRFEELPWARPLVALLAGADEGSQCDAVVREAVRCLFTHFPATIIPNKVVSALKDVMRKGVLGAKANLTEELATDIFQGAFSPNFDAAALSAAAAMRGTVYSRYYGLEGAYGGAAERHAELQAEVAALKEQQAAIRVPDLTLYSSLQQEIYAKGLLVRLAKEKMVDWGCPHSGASYNTVQSGRLIEAAMVLTTHNLAQCAAMCGGSIADAGVDAAASALKAWTYIVRTFVSPPTARRAVLHARRDVAYAWRQTLFFVSQAGAAAADAEAAQRAVLAQMREAVEWFAYDNVAADVLAAHFLTPLEAVIGGAEHPISEGSSAADGAIVLGYYGWQSFRSVNKRGRYSCW